MISVIIPMFVACLLVWAISVRLQNYLQKKLSRNNGHQPQPTSVQPHVIDQMHDILVRKEDVFDWSEETSTKSDVDGLKCRFKRNVLESESGSEADAVKDGFREEVVVEHVRSEVGLEDVEVLRVRHRRGFQGARWRDVEVTASALNYKPSLRKCVS